MSKDADISELEEVRKALLEDLAAAGESLLTIREMTQDSTLEKLMPAWKWQRFTRAISESASGTLRAMDCLSSSESPSTDSLVYEIIERWQKANHRDKEEIISTLRKAFTKPTEPAKANGATR